MAIVNLAPARAALAAIEHMLSYELVALVAIAALVVLLAWVGRDRSLLRPIRALSAVAAALTAGNLGARGGLGQRDDELGHLAAALDEMAARLEGDAAELARVNDRLSSELHERLRAEEALREAQADLEYSIAERTTALATANAELTAEIGQRERAQAALLTSEAGIRLVVDTALDAVVIMDSDGRITDWNAQAETIFGWPRAEALGGRVADLVIPERYRAAHNQGLRHFLATGDGPVLNRRIEVTALRRDGHEFPVELAIAALQRDGRYAFSAFLRDITDRKAMEEALRHSEARYRQLFEGHQAIALIWDPVSEAIVDANPAACAFYGHSDDTMKRMRLADLNIATAAERAEERARAAAEGRPYLHFQHRLASGTVRDVEAYSSSITVEGRPLRFTIIHDITERLRAERELAYLAYHDPLTGLVNRTQFMERLQEALAEGGRGPGTLAVLFLDLDGFKLVNDSLGHDAGDELLVAVGRRMHSGLRASDLLARLGGDEFIILLQGLSERDGAVRYAERLLAALREPFRIGGRPRYITASIGIACSGGAESQPEELVRAADIALHQAKAAGKARVAVYAPTMSTAVRERLELETDLRRAQQRGELRLRYQPDVDLASGAVTGVEALVRWQHPRRGLLAPASFIPLAEETNLILPLGQWVLREACRQAQAWVSLRPAGPPLAMSVNLSVQQLHDPRFVGQVTRILRSTGLDPAGLRLEITESVLMEDVDQTLAALAALRGLGVQLAIDDFGTGYSSLSYLARLPVTMLKIDRSFVQRLGTDTGTAAIVEATVALAHALDMAVTAEGIEEAEQVIRLRRLGCDRGQGYYFAQPLLPEAVPNFVERSPAPAMLQRA